MSIIFDRPWETMGGFCQGPLAAAAPMILQGAGTAMSLAGAMQEASGVEDAGKAQQANMEFQAKQQESIAGQERAASQRTMLEEKRKKDLVRSRAIAVSAGGGGSQLDILPVLAGIEQEGDFRAATALFEGEESARGFESQASSSRYQGEVAKRAAKSQASTMKRAAIGKAVTAMGSMASGSMFSKYAPRSNFVMGSTNVPRKPVFRSSGGYN